MGPRGHVRAHTVRSETDKVAAASLTVSRSLGAGVSAGAVVIVGIAYAL
jgi:hypothetical protein